MASAGSRAYNGGLGRSPHWGPGAEPLLGEVRGAKPPEADGILVLEHIFALSRRLFPRRTSRHRCGTIAPKATVTSDVIRCAVYFWCIKVSKPNSTTYCICNCVYTIGPSSDLSYSFYNDFKLQKGHNWLTFYQCSVFILLFFFCRLLNHCTIFYCCCCCSFESQMVKNQSSSMISFFLRSKKNYSMRPFAVVEKVSCQLIFNFLPSQHSA